MMKKRRRRHKPEEIVRKLRDAEAMLNAGKDLAAGGCELRGGRVPQGTVRPAVLVVLQSSPGEPTGFLEIRRLLGVQQLVAQTAEERFRVAVLPGTSRGNVQRLGVDVFQMLPNRMCDELRTVVAADVSRHTTGRKQIGDQQPLRVAQLRPVVTRRSSLVSRVPGRASRRPFAPAQNPTRGRASRGPLPAQPR